MDTVVKTRIVKIGNSRGIRIPKVWLEMLGLNDEVVMTVESNKLIIKPIIHPRDGWAEQFQTMAELHDDELLDGEIPTKWDVEEWEW